MRNKVVEKDPAKKLITLLQEEADGERKHELQLVELMLRHNSTSTYCNQADLILLQDYSGVSFKPINGGPHQN